MPEGKPASDEERLPWLEPYRDAIAHKQRVARRSHGGLVALAAAMAVLFAAAGGFWYGRRDIAPPSPATEIALAPPVEAPRPVVPAAPVSTAPVAEPAPTPKVEAAAPRAKAKATVRKKARRAAPVRQRKIRSAGIESDRLRAVRAAQERRVAPRPVSQRAWPKMPSPGPAGQVIQLGAFRTPARANRAYQTRLARYPVLGSMPRVVVPVVTRPRGQILYVLRLGTASRQQSRVVCRNLRASGDHCLVIG